MANSKKFCVTLTKEQEDIIKLAANQLGCTKTEIVRLGALKFAHILLDQNFSLEMLKQEID